MPSGFELRGAVQLARVAKALQGQGDAGKGFRKELQSSLVKATKPVRKDLKAAIPDALPKRGGLAAKVASDSSFVLASNRSRGATVGVRIQGKRRGLKGGSLRRFNSGVVRHPVMGNREIWVSQTAGVRKGFLDNAFVKQTPEMQRAVRAAIESTRNTIYRSIR
jgi:hypothetical protein